MYSFISGIKSDPEKVSGFLQVYSFSLKLKKCQMAGLICKFIKINLFSPFFLRNYFFLILKTRQKSSLYIEEYFCEFVFAFNGFC